MTTTSAPSLTAKLHPTKKAERQRNIFAPRHLPPRRIAAIEPHRASGVPSGPKPEGEIIFGAIAQLGERFNGIEEVVGSIPSGSTIPNNYPKHNNTNHDPVGIVIYDPGFAFTDKSPIQKY